MRLALRWRREIVCRDAVALATDYLEGALSASQRARFERHLAACDGCEEYLREMRMTIDLIGRVEPEDVPAPVLDELVGLLLRYRDEAAGGTSTDQAGETGETGTGADPDSGAR